MRAPQILTSIKPLAPVFLAAALASGCATHPDLCCRPEALPAPDEKTTALFNAMQALTDRAKAAQIPVFDLELAIIDAFDAATAPTASTTNTASTASTSTAPDRCGTAMLGRVVRFYTPDIFEKSPWFIPGVLQQKAATFYSACTKEEAEKPADDPLPPKTDYQRAIEIVDGMLPAPQTSQPPHPALTAQNRAP